MRRLSHSTCNGTGVITASGYSRDVNKTSARLGMSLHLGFHSWQPGVSTGLKKHNDRCLTLTLNKKSCTSCRQEIRHWPGWFCLFPFRLPFRGLLIFKWFMTKVAIKVVLFVSHPLLYFLIAHMCLWAEFLRSASSRRIRSFNCIPLNENRMSPWRAWLRGRWLFHTKLMLVSLTSWKTIVASTRTASKGAWWILNSCSIGQRKASKTHRETFAVRQPFNTPKHQNCYSQNTTVSHRIKAQVTVHRTVWSTSEVENHWNCADVHYKDGSRWHFQDQTDSSKAFLRPVLCLTWHMDAHGINPLEEMLAWQSTKSFFVMHLTKLISSLSDSPAFGMHKDLA